jgi:hypothetical protein
LGVRAVETGWVPTRASNGARSCAYLARVRAVKREHVSKRSAGGGYRT